MAGVHDNLIQVFAIGAIMFACFHFLFFNFFFFIFFHFPNFCPRYVESNAAAQEFTCLHVAKSG